MTIVIIQNFSCVLHFSISNKSIGSGLELKCLISEDVSMTLKDKTCTDNHSIPMSCLHVYWY